jgi:lipopolysaccharide/colanic/teichoic acid biosynthesis glycosyltransferase
VTLVPVLMMLFIRGKIMPEAKNPVNRLLKRLLDIAVSLPVVLFILPPLALMVWLIQRMHSPGPIFFTHGRNGRNNEIFQLFKFRTMHVANDDINRQASRSDPRIYPGGDLLRRTSLDEIPQFLNVLRGEMSVVGPRPHLPQHNRLWKEIAAPYTVRTFVRPGITGLAQTRGFRGEAVTEDDIRNRVECDIEYIERWTLLLDLGLILKTARQVIFPEKTAY